MHFVLRQKHADSNRICRKGIIYYATKIVELHAWSELNYVFLMRGCTTHETWMRRLLNRDISDNRAKEGTRFKMPRQTKTKTSENVIRTNTDNFNLSYDWLWLILLTFCLQNSWGWYLLYRDCSESEVTKTHLFSMTCHLHRIDNKVFFDLRSRQPF